MFWTVAVATTAPSRSEASAEELVPTLVTGRDFGMDEAA